MTLYLAPLSHFNSMIRADGKLHGASSGGFSRHFSLKTRGRLYSACVRSGFTEVRHGL